MAHLGLFVVLLVLESITAKYVLPDLPRDAPQSVFDDLPFDNKEMHISELTPLAEIKRMFEILDQMSVRAHVSDDSHGPVAWYEPQQDELLYDDGKCFDRFPKCQRFVDNGQCWEERFRAWVKSRCRKTCGFCEENCWDTKYGCCPDSKTAADGPAKAGCGVKLCVDLQDCEKVKDKCVNKSVWFKNNCAYTCRFCKAPNPKADCEARDPRPLYGCCWNGDEAMGWNGQGCLPCEDLYVRACKLFGKCDSPFYNVRKFVDIHCPKTCGRCGECVDKQLTSKCEKWERQGLCMTSGDWKQYMEEYCAKTCLFCESSGNVGVRSILGL